MSILVLKSSFSSAHLYSQPLWSEEKNREVFGPCFTRYGHGHNYTLEVGFKTGESAQDLRSQKQDLLSRLTQVLDHEHLNFVVEEFKTVIPTTENIALYFAEKLGAEELAYLRVYEMPDLWAEIQYE